MKYVALAVLLAVMQTPPPVPRKAADNAASRSQNIKQKSGTQKTPPPTPPAVPQTLEPKKNQHSSESPANTNAQETVVVRELPPVSVAKDWTDRVYWVFSGLLVVVGFLQAWLLFGTLRVIRRQGVSMRRQTAILRRSVLLARRSANAAKKGAEAALLNAQAIVNAERAWIVMEFIEESPGQFKLAATNYGRTPAQVIGYNIQHSSTFADSDLPPNPLEYSDSPSPQGQPFLVPTEEWPIESFSVDKAKHSLPGATQQKPMLYWGVLRYRNIINNAEHDTWFCQRYDARKGWFVLAGPPSYNRCT